MYIKSSQQGQNGTHDAEMHRNRDLEQDVGGSDLILRTASEAAQTECIESISIRAPHDTIYTGS